MKNFFHYFLIFFIYSVLGWIIETLLCSISNKKFTYRGFLIGPYCPIYGWGCILMILTLSEYKNNLFILFGMSTVICSVLEYFTSYLMEKLFHARWWDYSDKKYNVEGRICLKNSILFGLAGILVLRIIQPFLNSLLNSIPSFIIIIFSVLLLLVFLIDNICSFVVINKIKGIVDKVRTDISDEFGRRVKEIIFNDSILSRRLLIAYPDIKVPKLKIKK